MRLLGTTTSPYVRKARILLRAAGVSFELVDTRTEAGGALLARIAPSGKVPVLALDDGRVLPDSSLIAAYLWSQHAPALRQSGFELAPDAWDDRARQVVVEAALDAAINRFYLQKDGAADAGYVAKQKARVETCLAWLDRQTSFTRPIGHAALSLGCAIGWIDFRHVFDLSAYPALVAFRDAWEASGIGAGTEPG
jgi:glutathione S-transferase